MSDENVVLFIPLDISIINNPDVFSDQKLLLSNSNVPIASNTTDFEQYGNVNDIVYDPDVDNFDNQFPIPADDNPGDFSNIYIQLNQSNNNLEWSSSTNLCCRNCCHTFDARPWYLPVNYIDEVFIVIPIFCSPGCVLRFNIDSNHTDWNKRLGLFYLMYNKIYNSHITKIKLSPPTVLLDIHGGPYTIDEYREQSILKHDTTVDLVFPEIYSIVPTIREIKRKKNTSNEVYKLKRNKPMVRKNKSMLDSFVSKRV